MNRFPLFLLLLFPAAGLAVPFDAGKASFSVSYKEETSPYRVNAVFLMPGETLEVEVKEDNGGAYTFGPPGDFALGAQVATAAEAPAQGARAWKWSAPTEPGLYPLLVRRMGGDSVLLNAFVMVSASEMKGEYLEGYRIGKYPDRPLKGLSFYRNPGGYIRLDSASADAMVSPHFHLRQFLCKQSRSLPAYLVLRERLVLKLEAVLEQVNRHGIRCSTFHVMSGYRTPYYNRLIGNVKHSAHQFGGAADVFIDMDPVDGSMDDLNGDGRSDVKDSGILFEIVDKMSLDRYYLPYLGGVGKYSRNSSHGPFVHVDVRGFRAIW